MTRLASRPPVGPATSSSDPTLPALAASAPAPEESAPLLAPASVDCEAPGFGFLLAHPPALTNAVASIRTISIFRIPLSTLSAGNTAHSALTIERTVPRRVPAPRPAPTSIAVQSGHPPR